MKAVYQKKNVVFRGVLLHNPWLKMLTHDTETSGSQRLVTRCLYFRLFRSLRTLHLLHWLAVTAPSNWLSQTSHLFQTKQVIYSAR